MYFFVRPITSSFEIAVFYYCRRWRWYWNWGRWNEYRSEPIYVNRRRQVDNHLNEGWTYTGTIPDILVFIGDKSIPIGIGLDDNSKMKDHFCHFYWWWFGVSNDGTNKWICKRQVVKMTEYELSSP